VGLKLSALRYLAREHGRRPFTGPVLTLGRQCIYATWADVQALLRDEGIEPGPLLSEDDRLSNIPSWKGGPLESCTSDRAFWAALGGLRVETLDVSDHERADHLVDLNQPVPGHFAGRYDLILDGGTLEHIFDTRQAVRNVARMLRAGGRVIHMSPGSNFFEHGFYQFSPTFFFDYYSANGFSDLRCEIGEVPPGDVVYGPWHIRDWDPARPQASTSPHHVMVHFVASKTPWSTDDRVPQQGEYRARLDTRRVQASPGVHPPERER
jgi:SAM-dependent methyltransferase